eukprot:10389-Heterococcus_DN1.PRE.1
MSSDLFETEQPHLNESASVKSSASSESCTEAAPTALHPGLTTPDAKASTAAIVGQLAVKPDAASDTFKGSAQCSSSTSTNDGVAAST